MTDLLQRLRRDDAAALEELGQQLLPCIQASAIAQGFDLPDPAALQQMFRDEVALARSAEPAAFLSLLSTQLRVRATALPAIPPDIAQGEALSRLARVGPMPVAERELVVARFIERLPADQICKHFGLELASLAEILARGALLLVGPAPGFTTWIDFASLLNPDGEPVEQLVELEGALSCLAIDVTAFERNPVMSPLPVARPGFETAVPQPNEPSRVETQAVVDLPAEMGSFAPEPAAPPSLLGVRPLIPFENAEWQQRAQLEVSSELPRTETTAPEGTPLGFEPERAEITDPPTFPLGAEEPAPTSVAVPVGMKQGGPIDDGKGYFADVDELTSVFDFPKGPLPLHRRLTSRWWFGGAVFFGLLGAGLYAGMLSNLRGQQQRQWTLRPVLAAARDLPEGSTLMLEMLAIRAVPEVNVTASVVKPDDVPAVLGQKLEVPMQAGDPLLWSQFDRSQKTRRLDLVRRGRAYTIAVSEVKALGGMLIPNEEVDLVMNVTTPSRDPKARPITRAITLLQKVRVLAVGAVNTYNVGKAKKLSSNVTLLLVPEEVEVLSLARLTGEITTTLRNIDDHDLIPRGETRDHALLSGVRLKTLELKRGKMVSDIRAQPR